MGLSITGVPPKLAVSPTNDHDWFVKGNSSIYGYTHVISCGGYQPQDALMSPAHLRFGHGESCWIPGRLGN